MKRIFTTFDDNGILFAVELAYADEGMIPSKEIS
jgi:hypothetical protein